MVAEAPGAVSQNGPLDRRQEHARGRRREYSRVTFWCARGGFRLPLIDASPSTEDGTLQRP